MDKTVRDAEIAAGQDLTPEEAERLLVRLFGYYKEPVMPISRYCTGLRAWETAIQERARSLCQKLYPKMQGSTSAPETKADYALYLEERQQGSRVSARLADVSDLRRFEDAAEAVHHVFLMIRKSSLLDRLLYGGEKLRTRKCPQHEGTWSGLEHNGNICPHGCHLTGWLPEP